MRRSFLGYARICSVVFAFFLLAGCGKKTPPVPPETVLPAPIQDLSYQLDEKGVTLTWSYPTRTVRGEALPYRLKGFELYRAVLSEDDYCPDCPITFGPPIKIKFDQTEADRTIFFTETLLRAQKRYVYQVRSKAGWYITSRESNTASFFWDSPPGTPSDLQIIVGDRALSLSWKPPETYIDGTPVTEPLFYRVYRAAPNTDFIPVAEKVATTDFTDKEVFNDIKYKYQVRAVRVFDDTVIAGSPSSVQSGIPKDLAAPNTPQHVTAVRVEDGVKVFWQAVDASDLAGYRIYRRAANMDVTHLVGEVDAVTQTFIDKSPLTEAATWYYSVTAFDQSSPPNESTFSTEVLFKVKR